MPSTKKTMIKKRPTYININKRLKAVESSINAEETKKHYNEYNEVSISNSSSLPFATQINNLIQGDGSSTIDGVSYNLTGIGGRFLLHNVNNVPTLVRMVLIRVKSNASFTTVGEDLFLGSASLGTNYNSTSSAQRYFLPFNTHKYDVLYQKDLILGAKNATGTSQYTANRIVKFYKRFTNRKEYIDASSGSVMNTSYRMIIFPVDCAMDANSLNVEVTGHTIFYYKDN